MELEDDEELHLLTVVFKASKFRRVNVNCEF